jgi:hypothetical protein
MERIPAVVVKAFGIPLLSHGALILTTEDGVARPTVAITAETIQTSEVNAVKDMKVVVDSHGIDVADESERA